MGGGMNFTDHTARLALEKLCEVGLERINEVESAELNSLAQLIDAELQDRDQRVADYAEGLPF